MSLLLQYAPAFARGLSVTLLLVLIVWSLGVAGGIAAGSLSVRSPRVLTPIVQLSAMVFGAVPVLVLLLWLHFPAQSLLQIVVDPFITTAATLTVVNVVFVADIVNRTLRQLPSEWTLAARVAGLSERESIWRVLLPLAFRQLVGPVTLVQIYMLHCTLFGSLISVQELFRTIQVINSIEYRPVELYSFLFIFFLMICIPLHVFASWAMRRYAKDLSTV